MKRQFLLAAVMTLACAANLWADEKAAPGANQRPAASPGGGGGIGFGGGGGVVVTPSGGFVVPPFRGLLGRGMTSAQWYIESIDKIVDLTDAQKKAITASIEARDKAMQEFQAKSAEKLKAAATSMTEAFKSKDKEAIAKAQKAYQDIFAPMHEAMKKSQGELDSILTAAQRDKLQESRMKSWIKALTDPVQLTDEQMKKLRAAYDNLTKATGPEAVGRSFPEALQQILTAEQKAAVAKHRAMNYVKSIFARAKLSDEQMKKAETLVDELAKDQSDKGGMGWQSYSTLAEKIRGLLTAQQKEAMQAPFAVGGQGANVNPLSSGRFQATGGDGGAYREALDRRFQELSEKAERLAGEARQIAHEAREVHEAWQRSVRLPYQAQVQILPAQPMPGQILSGQPVPVRPDPAVEELRSQVQELRRQVEELKAMVRKAGDKK